MKPFAVIHTDRTRVNAGGNGHPQVMELFATHQEYKDRLSALWDSGHMEARATFSDRVFDRRWRR